MCLAIRVAANTDMGLCAEPSALVAKYGSIPPASHLDRKCSNRGGYSCRHRLLPSLPHMISSSLLSWRLYSLFQTWL